HYLVFKDQMSAIIIMADTVCIAPQCIRKIGPFNILTKLFLSTFFYVGKEKFRSYFPISIGKHKTAFLCFFFISVKN
ncbi:MAG: hypothetical protein JSW26_11735, partial [Desulfobacterales bacterium]